MSIIRLLMRYSINPPALALKSLTNIHPNSPSASDELSKVLQPYMRVVVWVLRSYPPFHAPKTSISVLHSFVYLHHSKHVPLLTDLLRHTLVLYGTSSSLDDKLKTNGILIKVSYVKHVYILY